jgi:RsmE family RNA methyltransferase
VVLGAGDEVRILIGPEGGWSARERELMGGVEMVRAGPHVMRIETAAVACVVALLNAGRV